MKKIFLAMMALIAMSISAYAESINVRFLAGHSIEGEVVYRDDTLVRMIPYYYSTKDELRIVPAEVNFFEVSGIGRFYVQDGRFVPTAKAQERMEKKEAKHLAHERDVQVRVSRQLHDRAADPNAVIAHALKTTGAAAIGLGIPSLVVGTILVAVGNTPAVAGQDPLVRINCATAGYVLMPFGAALTVVGIPLHVHGKRIAELKFNYTGNGAGIAMNF